jgi:hypothetical protein|tara:strand:+ start:39 stop:320 length:282 start_codon:yes stop_codon:yes gene_type:complete
VAVVVVTAHHHGNQVALMVVKEEVVVVLLGVVLVELLVHKEMMVVMDLPNLEFMAAVAAAVPVMLELMEHQVLVVLVVLAFRCQQHLEILHLV